MKILIALFLLPLSVYAGKSYTISVKVIDDATSEPIENVSVYFDGQEFGKTDNKGLLIRENCRKEFYNISVKKDGFYNKSTSIYSKKAKYAQSLIIRMISTDGPNISKAKLAEMEKIRASYDEVIEQEMNALKESLAKIDTTNILPCAEDTNKNKDNRYILSDDENTHFPGGAEELQRYIMENIEYPEIAIDFDEQGKIYASFVVEKDGTITNIEIVRGVSESLDAEAFRIIYGMPKWIPAHCNGRIIKSRQYLPIIFALN